VSIIVRILRRILKWWGRKESLCREVKQRYLECSDVVHGDTDVEEYNWGKKIKPKSIPVVVKCIEGSIDDLFVSKTVDTLVYTQYGWRAIKTYDGIKEIKEAGGGDG